MALDAESRKVTERIVIVLASAVSIAYGVLLAIPSGWHSKVTQIWSFHIGLFQVSVRMDTIGSFIFKKIGEVFAGLYKRDYKKGQSAMAKFVKALEPDDHSIQQLRDQFCNIELMFGNVLNSCWTWSYLLYGSWIMAVSLVMTIVFLLAGAGMLLGKETRCMRWTSLGMFCIAAFINLCGVVGYAFLSIHLNKWLLEIYGSHDGLSFSQGSIAAAGLTIVVCIIPGMVFACTNLPRKYDYDDEWEQEPFLYPEDSPPAVDQYGNPIDQYGNPMYSEPGPGGPYNQGYAQDPYAQQQAYPAPPGPGYSQGPSQQQW